MSENSIEAPVVEGQTEDPVIPVQSVASATPRKSGRRVPKWASRWD